MTIQKDTTIRDLMATLGLASRGWRIVDHWEADLQAVGVASERDLRRLIYISTFSRASGRYDYECETPEGPSEQDYLTTASGKDVDYETLLGAMEAHLGQVGDRRSVDKGQNCRNSKSLED